MLGTDIKVSQIDTALSVCEQIQSIPLDTLKKYSGIALDLTKNTDDTVHKLKAAYFRLQYFINTSQHDSALFQCDKIEAYPNVVSDTFSVKNKTAIMRGLVLTQKAKYQEALNLYFKLYPKFETEKDTASLARLCNVIGYNYIQMTRYNEAIRWCQKALDFKSNSALNVHPHALLNLAVCYINLDQEKEAIRYCNAAEKMANATNNLLVQANSFNVLGDIFIEQNKIEEAEEAILKAAAIRKKIGDPNFIISDLVQLSKLYSESGRYSDGLKIADSALQLAKEHKINSQIYFVKDAYLSNYYQSKQYKKAADLTQEMLKISDSINNASSAQALVEWEIKYETAKKSQKIKQQQLELSNKNNLIIEVVLLFILSVILFYFILRNKTNKQRALLNEMNLNQQKAITQTILDTEHSERTKIAANIHDGLGQYLSVLKMNLQSIKERNERNDTILPTLVNAQSLLNDSITELRNLSHQIMPSTALNNGLVAALRNMVDKIDATKLQALIEINEAEFVNLNQHIQLSIFRIIQECVHNTIKHANAQQIIISLKIIEKNISVSVSDNGTGFDNENLAEKGLGLTNMKNRVQQLNGTFNLKSILNQGTTISFLIPNH